MAMRSKGIIGLTVAMTLIGTLYLPAQQTEVPTDSGAYYTWDLVPMIIAAPGETLFFMTTFPLPAYHEICSYEGAVTVRLPLWHSIGGRITYADPWWIVYRAPQTEGIYLVYWENADRTRRFGFLVRVKENPVGDQTLNLEEFAGYVGAFVPLSNATEAPTAIFLARRRTLKPDRNPPPDFMDNNGNVEVDPPDKPFLPRPRRPNPCSGGFNNTKVKKEHARWREHAGSVTITAEIAAGLEGIGIRASVGQTIEVYAEWSRIARFEITDCYRCVNGELRWVGSRVDYEVCTWLDGYTPPWICRAVEAGILNFSCPKDAIYTRRCVSSSTECPCPPPGTPRLLPKDRCDRIARGE